MKILILLSLTALGLAGCQSSSLKRAAVFQDSNPTNHSTHLIIALDGIPYQSARKAWRRSEHGFQEPAAMISTFPSVTPVAFTAALQTTELKGYEEQYVAADEQVLKGGLIEYIRTPQNYSEPIYLHQFDFVRHRFHDTYAYGFPQYSVSREWQTLIQDPGFQTFLETGVSPRGDGVYKAYFVAPDALAHLGGENAIDQFLKDLLNELARIQKKVSHQLEITLYSDHGNDFRRSWSWVDLSQPIQNAGFRLATNLEGPKNVIMPVFGLVGYAALYTQDQNVSALAHALAQVEEIELVTYLHSNDPLMIHLLKNTEKGLEIAKIFQNDEMVTYQPVSGDPLELKKTLTQNRQQWFQTFNEHPLPNAINRIVDGHTQYVMNPAPVLASLKDGFYNGSRSLSWIASQIGSHGNLARSTSEAFFMSTTAENYPNQFPIDEFAPLMDRILERKDQSLTQR